VSCAALIVAGCGLAAANAGPDVVVWSINGTSYYGSSGGIDAYALGTTSCNRGDAPLAWFDGTVNHPVIAQNLYRLKDGRMEQVGMSWLKWAFASLNQNQCGTCINPPAGGSQLGINCSDPYGSGLNGSQGGLGARSLVNPFIGFHPPEHAQSSGPSTIRGRLQVPRSDMDPAQNVGAAYFGEAQYIAPDDALAGNDDNNSSVRRVWVNANHSLTFNEPGPAGNSSTLEGVTGIQNWQLLDPGVALKHTTMPSDGRVTIAWRAQANASVLSADFNSDGQTNITDLGIALQNFGIAGAAFEDGDANDDGFVNITDLGIVLQEFGQSNTFHYDFAVFNMNSDRAVQAVTVALPAGTTVSNVGFHDVDSHSGEPYSTTDWTDSSDPTFIRWETQTQAENVNANALRWGCMYNYWFDATCSPDQMTTITLDAFKQGAVNEQVVNLPNVFLNDFCGNAYKIFNPTIFFRTGGATTDGPDHPGVCDTGGITQTENDIWYRYNADGTGTVTVAIAADYDAKIAVYEGACGGAGGVFAGCDDDGGGSNPSVNFSVTNGEVYFIRIGGRNGETGGGEMSISGP